MPRQACAVLAMARATGIVRTMHFRSLVIALTTAGIVAGGCPVLAQQAAPVPSASPESAPSGAPVSTPAAAPTTEASAVPAAERSVPPADEASPATVPGSGRSLKGTLMSIKGTVATVKMANGAVQTYTVSTKVAAALKKSLGKKLLFRVVKGALDVVTH
ncbi:MAG: hypothetical protein JWM87_3293 [Candidatus Eremiobacteraeota bacterium]|nr:hypothetical protein [Candidatus Eremiobacteraeota bacterium]